MNDFESAFGEFIDKEIYDDAEEVIFDKVKDAMYAIVREAFRAGWLAAESCGDTSPGSNKE